MKTADITPDFAPVAVAVTQPTGIIGALTRLTAAMHASSDARRLRDDLAGLDAHLLRDIGIGDDEVSRVHAREAFVPRNWHE